MNIIAWMSVIAHLACIPLTVWLAVLWSAPGHATRTRAMCVWMLAWYCVLVLFADIIRLSYSPAGLNHAIPVPSLILDMVLCIVIRRTVTENETTETKENHHE